MISSIALVASIILFGNEPFGSGLYLTLFSIFISVLIIIRHKPNIKRILNGTESKIGKKVKSPDFTEDELKLPTKDTKHTKSLSRTLASFVGSFKTKIFLT